MRSIGPIEVLVFTVMWLLIWGLGWGGFFLVFWKMRRRAKERQLEMVHAERMAAMDKGIPLPELGVLEAPEISQPGGAALRWGIVWSALGFGFIALLVLAPDKSLQEFWTFPLPLVFVGAGLILYHVLVTDRAKS
jgi:hypothetical protein